MTVEMYQDVINHLQIDKYRELIIKQDQKITELEKACEETQELLDKQIEATYKLDKENAELKKWKEDTIKARGNDYMAWSRQNDQLTKARCTIASFVKANTVFDLINIKAEAENFLKESEVVK